MNSKTLKYLSYFAIVPGLIFMPLIKLKFLFMFPFLAISYFLKLSALRKTMIENSDSDNIEAIEKDINTSKWALIMLLGLGIVELIYRYS